VTPADGAGIDRLLLLIALFFLGWLAVAYSAVLG
jgi:hypothetical protein